MLYFAFGSNLNQKQMKRRCRDSKYVGCYSLKNYTLVFRNYFLGGGVADVQKKKNSSVLGAIYKISKKDEKELDIYEDFPKTYIKKYFSLLGKKVMFYYMPKKRGLFLQAKGILILLYRVIKIAVIEIII